MIYTSLNKGLPPQIPTNRILCGFAGNYNDPGPSNDAQYFYMQNRLGNVMALLNGSNSSDTLEFYRYDVYGHTTALPIVDNNSNGLEDTPYDLTDNNTAMLTARSSDASAGRHSEYQNEYLFVARRLDEATGLCYYRCRYYSKEAGRFVSRDPVLSANYTYVGNFPASAIDPSGLVGVFLGGTGKPAPGGSGMGDIYNDYSGDRIVVTEETDVRIDFINGLAEHLKRLKNMICRDEFCPAAKRFFKSQQGKLRACDDPEVLD